MLFKKTEFQCVLGTILLFMFLSVPPATATDVSGDVWGEWSSAGNPYNVTGDLRVPPGSTLFIGPGCYIEFQGYYQFLVDTSAVLQAMGTEADSITFTWAGTGIRWDGLRFNYADSGSQITYCRIEYCHGLGLDDGGAIQCNYSYLEIKNSLITNNSASHGSAFHLRDNYNILIDNNLIKGNRGYRTIFSTANLRVEIRGNTICQNDSTILIITGDWPNGMIISNNRFFDNIYGDIMWIDGSPEITGNIIYDNVGTIFCRLMSGGLAVIRSNIIYHNYCPEGYGGGIFLSEDTRYSVENNTIWDNSGGQETYLGFIFEEHSTGSPVVFKNNIIWGNDYPEDSLFHIEDANFTQIYSDIQGGWSGVGNINADPLFVDTANGDFHLLPDSPCIDAGDPASPLDPDGTIADMGALYFDQTTGILAPSLMPDNFALHQNYPNPFNGTTQISFTIPAEFYVTINVFDLLGRRVITILNKQLQAGEYSVNWDGKSDDGRPMASGIYFYNLRSDGFEDSKKMVILK